MIPVLFNKEETTFTSLGLGEIDATVVEVERERNGIYSLYMELPFSSDYVALIEQEMQIKADAGARTKWQTFKVNRVIKDTDKKIVKVYADHISMDTINDAMRPRVAIRQQTAEDALRQWNANRISEKQYDVSSDITTVSGTTWTIDEVENARQALGGVEGSILDVWGGEFEFDNNRIILHKEMGREAPTVLEYGRNIVSLEYEELIDGVYTSIYPYASYTPRSEDNRQQEPIMVTLDELIVDGDYVGNYQNRRVQIVDFSSEFDSSGDNPEIPTQTKLRSLAKSYVKANEVGAPKITQEVDFVDLSKTLDYADMRVMEEIELNDRVPIFYPNIKITSGVKVTKTVWQPLINQYKSITVSTIGALKSSSLNSDLKTSIKDLEKQQKQINNTVPYLINAQGNRIWYTTPDDNMEHKIDDTWFKKNGKYTIILKWNGSMWEEVLNDETFIAEIEEKVAKAQGEAEKASQSAKDAVEKIDTAVANAGFTSLDETLQNMNNMTAGAEQNAQQAITDATNAYGLAQTSISEAQTAQANSLIALGNADNALDGVSNLDIRIDDVEDELELKADNTFINEDGTLTTLSNAITFNANRFSTDMNRIESRVESLAGEINLVVLRGSIENRLLYGTEVFPDAPTYSASTNVMGELINVVGGESFALSKELTGADDRWRIVFYDENHNFISRFHPPTNTQDIMNAPLNARYMWVSYPKDSKPQITRGTDFIPYRPNIADQMTTDEVVMFRNEYDEFADRTERRLTAIDSSDGRLATAELLITHTAGGLALKADQSTVDTLAGTVSSLGSDFDIVAGQVSSKVWKTDIDNIKIGGRNYFPVSKLTPKPAIGVDYPNNRVYHFNLEPETDYIISTVTNLIAFRVKNGGEYYKVNFAETNDKGHKLTTDTTGAISIGFWGNEVDSFIEGKSLFQIEKGNKSTDWIPALEDNDAKIDHIETEWTQKFDTFSQTVSSIDGRVTGQKQTIDSISSAVSGHDSRISTVEQIASGLQTTVADKASQSQVTQLADGYDILVAESLKSLVPKNLHDGASDWVLGGNVEYIGQHTNNLSTIYVTGSNPDTSYGGNRIQVHSVLIPGRRYKITLDVWSVSNRNISIGQADSSNNVRLTVGNTTKTYEVVYEAINTNGFSIYFHNEGTYRIGNIKVMESTAISQSQISVLKENINLRVSKAELLTQINIQANSALIQSGTNKLNVTPETTFIQDATIKSAMIESLVADKIVTGTFDASKAKIINLDADSITSNQAKLIQAGFTSSSGGTLSLNGDQILSTASNNSQVYLQNGIVGMRNPSGATIGQIGYAYQTESPWYSMQISHGSHFQIRMDRGAGELNKQAFYIISGGTESYLNTDNIYLNPASNGRVRVQGAMTVDKDLRADGTILVRSRLEYLNGGYIESQAANSNILINATNKLIIYTNGTNALEFDANNAVFRRKISDNSDIRLKTNVVDMPIDSLEAIRNIEIKKFDYLDGRKNYYGIIAQQAQNYLPELINTDSNGYLMVDKSAMTYVNMHAIQQLDSKVDNEISQLKAQIASLQDELALLKGA